MWLLAGGIKDHNYLNSGVNPINNYTFGILTSRAIDWYIIESILIGSGGRGGSRILSRNIIFGILSSSPVDWHPCWVIWLKGGSGFLVIPQVGRRGVFRQVTSNWFQTCSLRIALCISCMIEVKKCFGKGFGWICALNRWSVQERAQTSFCCQIKSLSLQSFRLSTSN